MVRLNQSLCCFYLEVRVVPRPRSWMVLVCLVGVAKTSQGRGSDIQGAVNERFYVACEPPLNKAEITANRGATSASHHTCLCRRDSGTAQNTAKLSSLPSDNRTASSNKTANIVLPQQNLLTVNSQSKEVVVAPLERLVFLSASSIGAVTHQRQCSR